MRRYWENFQCRGALQIRIIVGQVGQGPIALALGAGGGCLDIFFLSSILSLLSPSLWEMARYRLKYCLKGPLNSKELTNQPIVGHLSIPCPPSVPDSSFHHIYSRFTFTFIPDSHILPSIPMFYLIYTRFSYPLSYTRFVTFRTIWRDYFDVTVFSV